MVKIGLFCAAGFSTGMLVNNMKIAAAEEGRDAEIEATAICDSCHTPIAVIPMADYGMLDGEKVLNLALSLLDKH